MQFNGHECSYKKLQDSNFAFVHRRSHVLNEMNGNFRVKKTGLN